MNKPYRVRGAKAATALSLVFAIGAGLVACGGGGGAATGGATLPLPGGGGGEIPDPPAPPLAPDFVRTFQDASNVIGQSEFTRGLENQGNAAPDATTLLLPSGLAVSPDGALLFIADSGNRRILGYREVPSTPGQAASMVFGRTDFVSGDFIDDPATLRSTSGMAVGDGVIAVADGIRQRVLIYPIPTADGATFSPIAVVGKQNLDDTAEGCDQQTLHTPSDVQITPDGKLIVADAGGHRVLIWNHVPTTDGVLADAVLGQPNFVSCDRNAGGGDTPSRGSMYRPFAIWSDGTRLAVADRSNDRVLLWDNLYDGSGVVRPSPDRVVGQPGFGVKQVVPSNAATPDPTGVASNGSHLAVAMFNRVIVWNAWPSQNMQPANSVLGQPDFESNDANNGLTTPTAQSLSGPGRLAFHQDKLLVLDRNNNRVLIFRSE